MMKSLDIFNELSEHVTIRINFCRSEYHDASWVENKTHQDYDLWLILDGELTITTGDRSFRVLPADIVLG